MGRQNAEFESATEECQDQRNVKVARWRLLLESLNEIHHVLLNLVSLAYVFLSVSMFFAIYVLSFSSQNADTMSF